MYEEKVEELEITIDVRDAQIQLLRKDVERLENKIREHDREKSFLAQDQLRLERMSNEFQKRVMHARYYEALVALIENNASLQGEWVKFMTYIKLICDPEELKEIL